MRRIVLLRSGSKRRWQWYTRRLQTSDNKQGREDVQFVPHDSQRCDESYAKHEAHDLGDKGVEASHDEEAPEDRRTDVAGGEDARWVSASDDGRAAHVWVDANFHDRPSGKDGLAESSGPCPRKVEV